jgi:hypothetical protein
VINSFGTALEFNKVLKRSFKGDPSNKAFDFEGAGYPALVGNQKVHFRLSRPWR